MVRRASGYRIKLLVSLVVAAAVVWPLAIVGVSEFRRNQWLDRIASNDPAVRERALNRLIHEAPSDPRWAKGVIARLDSWPDDAFVPVWNAMDAADLDDRGDFDTALARQLPRLSETTFRAVAPLLLSRQPQLRDDVVQQAVLRFDAAPPETREGWVRFLDAQHAWATPPVPVDIYIEWLARGVESPVAELRERTARRLGDLPITQPEVDPKLVADPLRRLLADEQPAVRRAALIAMAGYTARTPDFLIDIDRAQEDEDEQVRDFARRLVRLADTPASEFTPPHELAPPTPGELESLLAQPSWEKLLIALDHSAPASRELTLDPAMPHLVRIAATRVSSLSQPDWLRETLRVNGRPALRDLACVVLAARFDTDQLKPFVAELLIDHDPDARRSGVILAGLTGCCGEMLREMKTQERRVLQRRVIQLGRWMQGRAPELDDQVAALLGWDGIPESTIYLALLHGGKQRAVLDHLLAIGADAPADESDTLNRTAEFLCDERWGQVLSTYLPASAPALRLDAEATSWQNQIRDLRAWHALHRFTP